MEHKQLQTIYQKTSPQEQAQDPETAADHGGGYDDQNAVEHVSQKFGLDGTDNTENQNKQGKSQGCKGKIADQQSSAAVTGLSCAVEQRHRGQKEQDG